MITTQTQFRTALLDPSAPAPDGLQNPDGVAATKRFDVYRNNVAVSLSDALETAFPVVRKLVGDDFFRATAGVYLRAHPPTSPVMMFYGEEMPAFLDGFEPAKTVPYLPDMARLELALRHSYHAADSTPIAADALGQIAPDALPNVTFTFAPSVHLISVDPLTPEQSTVTSALMASETLGDALRHGGAGFDFGALLGVLLTRNALISINT